VHKKRLYQQNDTIILASSSKSRKTIFKNVKINFLIKKPKINEEKEKREIRKKGCGVILTSKILAQKKAESIAKQYKNNIVVGCDTIIKLKNKPLDKARSIREAKIKLKMISGKKHSIYTSVCVYKQNTIQWTHTEKTDVYVRQLNDKETNYYLKQSGKEILTSVGCYQAEKMGPFIFSKIKGDFYNVLGFPILNFMMFLNKSKKQYE